MLKGYKLIIIRKYRYNIKTKNFILNNLIYIKNKGQIYYNLKNYI